MTRFSHPFILDIEASGFGNGSYPIEVGLALQPNHRYCSLIKPEPSWTHWDVSAEAIHKIPRQLLTARGQPARTVAGELNELLTGKAVFSDGWVVDKPWLLRLFEAAEIQMQFSIHDIQTILSEKQVENWHTVKQSVIEELRLSRHRASNDAQIIQETFKRSL